MHWLLLAVAFLAGEHSLESSGSGVVAHGLSCPEAHGIFLDQGWNLCPLLWRVDSSPVNHQGSPLFVLKMRPIVLPLRVSNGAFLSSV